MEIEAFFRNLSPSIQRSMGELLIIYIPGKERILACLILELQVKKGRASSLLFSICTTQDRCEVPTDLFLQLQVTDYLGSHHCGLSIPILSVIAGIVGNLLNSNCLFSFPLLFHPHTGPLRSLRPHATFKGLSLKSNYALLDQ